MSNHYIFGKKAILDAINNNKIKNIKATKKHYDFLNTLSVKYEIVDKNFFRKFNNVNHQEIIGYINQENNNCSLDELINWANMENKYTILIVDKIESPYNFGAILRTAAAFSVDAVIYKNNNQAPLNDVVIKTSIGGINYLKLCNVSNINYAIEKLQNNNFWIYGSTLGEKSIDINEIDFANKCAIILGNEDKGISKLTLDKCDYLFKIPMTNKIQSLNVSVATGIILFKRFNNL